MPDKNGLVDDVGTDFEFCEVENSFGEVDSTEEVSDNWREWDGKLVITVWSSAGEQKALEFRRTSQIEDLVAADVAEGSTVDELFESDESSLAK